MPTVSSYDKITFVRSLLSYTTNFLDLDIHYYRRCYYLKFKLLGLSLVGKPYRVITKHHGAQANVGHFQAAVATQKIQFDFLLCHVVSKCSVPITYALTSSEHTEVFE